MQQKLLSMLNASGVNTKREAGGTYINTIRQLMGRLGSAPDIARRGSLIILVLMSIELVHRWW